MHLILEFRPALRMEEWFETFFGLQKDGKVNPNSGLPNALQWAVISREYEDEIYLAWPPLLVQRVRFGLLATIGKLVGYKTRYPAYSGAEEPLAGREGERPSAASGAMREGIVVGAIIALIGLFLLGRRGRTGRRREPRFQLLRTPARRSSHHPIAPILSAQDAPEGQRLSKGIISKSSVVDWDAHGCWTGAMRMWTSEKAD